MARKTPPVVVANWARGAGIKSRDRKHFNADIGESQGIGFRGESRFVIRLVRPDARELSVYLSPDSARLLAAQLQAFGYGPEPAATQ